MDNATTPVQPATAAPAQAVAPTTGAPAATAPTAEATPATNTSPAAHEGGGHEGITYNPKMPEPQIINGVKVYPTSYIPAKAELHTPKKTLVELEGHHIEVIHVVIFIGLTVALFIGMWKRPNLR